jgi:glycosyltransferase involved in cell wall biosynthesis
LIKLVGSLKSNESCSCTVSVIIPSLNEQSGIGICVKRVHEVFRVHGIDGEIIVSDNSTDETPFIAEALGAKVVTPDRRGYGYAYRYAVNHSHGEFIVMGDADGSYDFLDIHHFLKPLQEGSADLVVGNRFKGEIVDGAMPWSHRYVGNPVLAFLLRFLFQLEISDAQCGFRAIRRDVFDSLGSTSVGMEFASEMVILSALKGVSVKEVPITYFPRLGRSKLRSFSDGFRIIWLMLRYFFHG